MTSNDPQVPPPPPGDPLAVLLPAATRFRRKLVWGGLISGGAILAGVFAYGFLHSNGGFIAKRDAQVAANQKPQKPDLASFPQDYSQIKPLQPQPSPTTQPVSAANAPAARGTGQPTEQERARASNVFFPQTAGNAQQTNPSSVAPVAPQAEPQPANLYGTQPLPADAVEGLAPQK